MDFINPWATHPGRQNTALTKNWRLVAPHSAHERIQHPQIQPATHRNTALEAPGATNSSGHAILSV